MSRPELVVAGEVVVAARADGLETAEAVGVGDGRVVLVGGRQEVIEAAAPGAVVIDAGPKAVVPGLHDFHLHLVGLARQRREVLLDDPAGIGDIANQVASASAAIPTSAWVLGRGWTEAQLRGQDLGVLETATAGRPTWLSSHDGHSAWVSRAARSLAGIGPTTLDPPGGRIERDADGPTGILRETARDLVEPVVVRPRGGELGEMLEQTLVDLWALGLTGMTDAGAYTTDKGDGPFRGLGDDFSALADLAPRLDGRVRLTLNLPAAALLDGAAVDAQLRTGRALADGSTIRGGWAKAYADGALGSRTAALYAPYSCGDGGATGDAGILRLEGEALDELLAAGRAAGIGLAVHAIGDRTAATVLDAVERAGPRRAGVPRDRMEHVQLLRPVDRPRLKGLGVIASLQPLHAPADRDMVERCWAGCVAHAYATRSLARAGAHLAFGSDAPVEAVNPWLGILAAVRRRQPGDPDPGWRPDEGIDLVAALSAYTLGPAAAIGASDEGHLRPGAVADLAVLNVDLATILAADDRLADVRSELTLVGGREVHRS